MPLIPTRWKQRRKTTWLLIAGSVVALWLLGSLFVAHRLTRRPHPVFAEPPPAVAWGDLESHRIGTGDGHTLGAWFARGKDDAPGVLLLHGNGGSRWNCLPLAEVYAAEGCAVLLVSLRAHGDSTGEVNDIGYSARHDVLAAVAFLERERPGRPIVVHGQSLGAAAAAFASGAVGGRVRGYVLECPYRDLKTALWNRIDNAAPGPIARLAYLGMVAVAPVVLPYVDAIAPVEAVRAIPADVPVLVLAGGSDRKARPDEARAIAARLRSHATVSVFDGAGHVGLSRHDPERYRRELLHLLGRAAGPERR